MERASRHGDGKEFQPQTMIMIKYSFNSNSKLHWSSAIPSHYNFHDHYAPHDSAIRHKFTNFNFNVSG
jgi:hypothetical protein